MSNTPIAAQSAPALRASDFLIAYLADYPQFANWAFALSAHNMQIARANAEIGLMPVMENVAKNVSACGDIQTNLSQVSVGRKIFTPVEKRMHLKTCYKDIESDTVFASFRPYGNSMGDLLLNPDFVAFMEARGMAAYIKDVLTEAWFADPNNTDFGSGSGTETLSPGMGYAPYVNQQTGFFSQLATLATAGTIGKYTIAANSQATTALQFSTLSTENAIDTIYNTYLAADPLLLEQPSMAIQVTASIYNKAAVYLNKQSNANGFGTTVVNGRTIPTLLGLPIIARPDWDKQIKQKFNNGTTLDRPHRLVMAPTENLFIGMEVMDEGIRMISDPLTDFTHTKFGQRLDYLVLDDSLAAVAW